MGQPVRGDADDAGDLFHEAVRGVTPLADRRRVPPPRRSSGDLARSRERGDGSSCPDPGSGASLQTDGDGARAFGVSRKTLRDLAAGRPPVEATLDLHRHTARQARERLVRFLAQSRARRLRAVLIVTGKGERSSSLSPQERLRSLVPAWLSGPLASAVLAFTPARVEHGGAGALYVLLRSLTP